MCTHVFPDVWPSTPAAIICLVAAHVEALKWIERLKMTVATYIYMYILSQQEPSEMTSHREPREHTQHSKRTIETEHHVCMLEYVFMYD